MILKRTIFTAAIAVVMSLSSYGANAADVTLRFAHWVPPVHPLHKAFVAWGKRVTEASGGSIKLQYFPASQLGKAGDHYDMAKDGIADVTWINPGFNPGRWPITALPEHAFILKNARGASKALSRWYAEYAQKEMKEIKYCLMHTMIPQAIYSTKKPIRVPADLKGIKMRPSNSTQAKIFKAAGATTVFFPFPKIRDNFDRGIATASTGVPGALIAFGGHKATKHVTDEPVFGAVWLFVMNKAVYGKMNGKQKAAVDANCNAEAALRIADPVAKFDENGNKRLKDMGKNYIKLSASDIAQWRKLSDAALEGWKATVKKRGFNGDEILASLRAKLKEENSLVE